MYFKLFEEKATLNDDNNQSFDLKYLIEGSNDFNDYIYGVKIEKYDKDKLIEEAFADSITKSKQESELIIHMLIDNLVTPTTLFYIIDDFISKKESVI